MIPQDHVLSLLIALMMMFSGIFGLVIHVLWTKKFENYMQKADNDYNTIAGFFNNVIGKYPPLIDQLVFQLNECDNMLKEKDEFIKQQQKDMQDYKLMLKIQQDLIDNLIKRFDELMSFNKTGEKYIKIIQCEQEEIKNVLGR